MDVDGLVAFVSEGLAARADPAKAAPMQAYMKTEMPFFGVQKPGRTALLREVKRRFVPPDRDTWQSGVLALWARPHREERYLALAYARAFPAFVDEASLPLFERLVREGAWWDLVDEVAIQLIGVTVRHRARVLDPWIADDDVWIRRTSLIHQVKHRENTDEDVLFERCAALAPETSFWIRKGIGWALREYAKHVPEAVARFVERTPALSALSRREAAKGVARGRAR